MTLEEIFGPKGFLRSRLPHYEYRPSQLAMAQAVLDAIQEGHHLCVEAGTGTGKTLAYLIPALFSRKRVMVSTATKNLQEQLFFKDLPFIKEHLFPNLSVTYMKGRQNYLCLKRFYERAQEWSVLCDWVKQTETGDRAELSWIRDDDPLWRELDARSETCVGQKCSFFNDCYITRMRQKALESDIIVVNHALFFANLALQMDEIGKVLPDYAVVILDEAHEVEDIVSSHFGKQASNFQVEEFCRDFQNVFSQSREFDHELAQLQSRAATFFGAFPGLDGRYSLNFYARSGSDAYDFRMEILDLYRPFENTLRVLFYHLQRHSEKGAEADAIVRRLEQLICNLSEVFNFEDSEKIYWFEKRGRGVFLHITPVDVASILRDRFFNTTEATILTSATLTTDNNFNYLKERLGIPEPQELILPAEFNYREQAILYIPEGMPEPHSPRYFSRALQEIEQIIRITDGHAFLLFTSFQQMNKAYDFLGQRIQFPLFRQGEMPKNQLLQAFKQTPGAVLCATSSFWQGVDVQGDALRAVIIDKLPFLVPTEPIVAARIHRLEKRGENSFLRYSVPEAIITLKQGLGRLIRSRQDRGILAILDSRLRTRHYGRQFLESLPNCPVTGKIEDLKSFFVSKEFL